MSGAEVAGLIMAAPQIMVYIAKIANAVVKTAEQNKMMKESIQHLKVVTLETSQIRLKQDMELGKRILKDASVSQPDKDHLAEQFNHALKVLKELDTNATVVLERADAIFSRKKRVALVKISALTRELELSLNTFHDMVISVSLLQASESLLYLSDHDFTLVGPDSNHVQLNRGTFMATGRLSKATPRCTTEVQEFVLESKPYGPLGAASVKTDLDLLSRRLDAAQIAEGILPLIGFRDQPAKKEFHLVFRAESYMSSGQTLLHRLRLNGAAPSLNYRIGLCASLAEAVLHVHSLSLVHKNIRPENAFLAFDPIEVKDKLFLLGWQFARDTENFQTRRLGGGGLAGRVYQHPQRQMEFPEHNYSMAHDIYSLGVCMLEVLTWSPLLLHPETNGHPVVSTEYREAFSKLGFDATAAANSSRLSSDEHRYTHRPYEVQKVLIDLAKTRIPVSAGGRMAEIVHQCLTCLDSEDGLGGGSSFQGRERDEKEIGVTFAEAVLKDIRSICSAI